MKIKDTGDMSLFDITQFRNVNPIFVEHETNVAQYK